MTKCGFVAIVGRPNVGKSSLLNAIFEKKMSITSSKPQTTRFQIQGIKTIDNTQTIYVDTPGIHLAAKNALNRQMNKAAYSALTDVNVAVFMVEALQWTAEDDFVLKVLENTTCPIIIALNKIDLVSDKDQLLSFIQMLNNKLPKAEIIPISAKKNKQIDTLEKSILPHLPESPFYFDEDQITNVSPQFHTSEIVREKLMRFLSKEIPYAVCVQIEKMEKKPNIIHIHALIWAEREGQKRIIIGDKGSQLKEIGTRARKDLEHFYGMKVCLKLWVKVKENWSNDMMSLQNLGFTCEV